MTDVPAGAAPTTARAALALSLLATFGSIAPVTAATVEALDECDARVQSAPRDPASYYCYLLAFRAGAPGHEAVRRLDAILAVHPGLHRARMILGMIEDSRASPRAEQLLREAVDGMEDQGDQFGVVYGALSLAHLLGERGRLDEAEHSIGRAERAARSLPEPEPIASVWTEQAQMAGRRADYGRSLHLLRLAEEAVFPDGPSWLKGNVLSSIAYLYWYFDDLRTAMATYQRESEIRSAAGESRELAAVRANQAFIAMLLADRGELAPEACSRLIDEALEAVMAAGDLESESRLRLLRSHFLEGLEAVRECERAIDLADRSGDAVARWSATSVLARKKLDLGPRHEEEALELVGTVIEEVRHAGMPENLAEALTRRAELISRVGTVEESVAAWEESIEVAESIGRLQEEDINRALTMSHWSYPYHQVIGLLLDGLEGSSDPEADLEKAFRTMERRQARSLLEVLAGEEEASSASRPGRYPTLDEIRSALGDDEVMLVYQIAHEWEGRSWLLAVKPAGIEVRELPSSRDLDDAVTLFDGMIRARDDLPPGAAVDLFEMVTCGTLDDGIDRLSTVILVPDGPLHRLPFAALRERPDAGPLGTRLRIDVLPAVALWMRWRTSPSRDERRSAFSLADPEISPDAAMRAFRDPTLRGGDLPPGGLPRAREEGRFVARAIGGKSRVLTGAEASESALKTMDPATYGMLHLATHAVADGARPEHSAVLLAPGESGEDGLLHAGEIAHLDLKGDVVILSACRGAAGPVIGGEGVMGLARAFLLAGARAVVANRWPYNDADAERLTRALAEEIGRGSSIGDALTEARRAQVASGASVASWAGLTLIGDGGVVPVPGGNRSIGNTAKVLIVALGLVALICLVAVLRRR